MDKKKNKSEKGSEITHISTSTDVGQARLLLEGSSYFITLRNMLLAVKAGSYSPDKIGSIDNPTIENLVKDIGESGRTVRVLMWDQGRLFNLLFNLFDSTNLTKDIFKAFIFKGKGYANAKTIKGLDKIPNATALLEKYVEHGEKSSTSLASQHQKMVICSVKGDKAALISGFNNITPEYYDEKDHPMNPDGADKNDYHSWHDAGILLQGPVVDQIEKEFDRRWKKVATKEKDKKIKGDYIKIAAWNTDSSSCLGRDKVCSEDAAAAPYTSPLLDSHRTYKIYPLITNSEFHVRITQIYDELKNAISSAKDYIYFENFALFDLNLSKEISSALLNNSNLKLYINTIHPRLKGHGGNALIQLGQYFFTGLMVTTIAVLTGEWRSLRYEKKGNIFDVKFSDVAELKIISECKASSSRSFLRTKIQITTKDGEHIVFLLRKIKSIDINTDRIILMSPARYFSSTTSEPKYELINQKPGFRSIYVHSKLAYIDNNFVLCGSANFTSRSFYRDGELSIKITDSQSVSEMKKQILSHWNVPNGETSNIPNWLNTFKKTKTDGVGLIPLDVSDLLSAGKMPMGFDLLLTFRNDPDSIF